MYYLKRNGIIPYTNSNRMARNFSHFKNKTETKLSNSPVKTCNLQLVEYIFLKALKVDSKFI